MPSRRAFGLQPHRSETFKLSPDPLLIPKVRDIVGLYVNPPEHAVVLCVDEKSQIRAPDRTAPLLPMRPGQAERRTHDYKRHGTISLFAALDTQSSKVIGQAHRRHRSVEFRKFLDRIDASVPLDHEVHIIMDNYGTHKTPRIRAWFAKHPRFHVHFTPTYGSWLNLVERWFAELTTHHHAGEVGFVGERVQRSVREEHAGGDESASGAAAAPDALGDRTDAGATGSSERAGWGVRAAAGGIELVEVTPAMQWLESLPGVGVILAATIAQDVGEERFPSAERLASYAGTTPRVHASGNRCATGGPGRT